MVVAMKKTLVIMKPNENESAMVLDGVGAARGRAVRLLAPVGGGLRRFRDREEVRRRRS